MMIVYFLYYSLTLPVSLNETHTTLLHGTKTEHPQVLHSLRGVNNLIQSNKLVFAPEIVILGQEQHAMALLQQHK